MIALDAIARCENIMKSKKHPGFKKTAQKIADKEDLSISRADAILANATRNSSPEAKDKNPRLKKVEMPKKK